MSHSEVIKALNAALKVSQKDVLMKKLSATEFSTLCASINAQASMEIALILVEIHETLKSESTL